MKTNGNGPIVALDIDGTLGDYHGHFLRFAESWYGRAMPDPDEINPGLPLHRFMHTSKSTYRRCKLAYRQGGLKRSMPVYPGADELCKAIRRAGAELWITTTRPYLRYDTIDPDTREWLRRNRLQYDAVLYGERKYRDLARIAGEGVTGPVRGRVEPGRSRVVAVLDDLPEMIEQAQKLDMIGILRDQPYNKHYYQYNYQVADMEKAKSLILTLIYYWKEDHGNCT